ncbi:MAG: isoprenyl transferase [Deltaproteobacteria bacterium]|nr:isoprenyl transferase [Deltaproteobacteria bacterium]
MEGLIKEKLPKHVAIIMDGNGRWAKKHGKPRIEGHLEGVKSVREIVETARELGIKVLTLYAFSYENWQRPKEEISALMELLNKYLNDELENMLKNDIQLMAIGELDLLPTDTYNILKETIKKTKDCKGMILNLALSYGGRQEIIQATKRLVKATLAGRINIGDISPSLFGKYLYTAGLPDPDLLIRTSGEMRISNFLLWQLAYTEIYITPIFWPEFRRAQFIEALKAYQLRNRRFGKIPEQE